MTAHYNLAEVTAWVLSATMLIAACTTQPPMPTNTPTAAPTPTPTAIPPAGFVYSVESTLGVTLARPSSWQRDAGTRTLPVSGGTVRYAVYYEVSPGRVQMVTVWTVDQPFGTSDEEALIQSALGQNQQALEAQHFEIIERFRDLPVAGQSAFALSYRITDPSGMDFYSIILTVEEPDDDGLLIQWTSNEDISAKTRTLFLTMLPTIAFSQ